MESEQYDGREAAVIFEYELGEPIRTELCRLCLAAPVKASRSSRG
jgi:hypothetical protein